MKSKFDKHESRLSTTDEHGNRVYVHPEHVQGKWRNRRTIFYWFLISIYLVLPWIYYNNQQLVQLKIPEREFHFFTYIFYGHNTPFIFFLLLSFPLLIAFLTSLYGRVWCGFACPQTVFIDAIFLKIEKWVEGTAIQREKLQKMPWNASKLRKKALKWGLFTIASLHIAHSFVGYFVGTHELFWITLSPPWENWTLFLLTMGITALCLFDFGWFREQFCLIACPYGRFQSVMMDDDTLTVTYDYNRGEPRRSVAPSRGSEGDCVNCYQCVKVCPTGIDIRRGSQLECIACTNCIDACDDIMRKLGRPEGLIRYASENELKQQSSPKFLRPRNLVYLGILCLVISTMVFLLMQKPQFDVVVINQGKSPYELIDKTLRNQKLLKVSHTKAENVPVGIRLSSAQYHDIVAITTPFQPWNLKKGLNSSPLFLTMPIDSFQEYFQQSNSVTLELFHWETQETLETFEVYLVGPK